MDNIPSQEILTEIVDRISVGVFVVNKDYELVTWNTFMENYSQKKSIEVVGKNIFEAFPELPRSWLEQKINNVFILKNFSFTSWEHRPYIFKFLHNRPITGGIDYMRQNCTFFPIKSSNGEIENVCITLFDVTDTSVYQNMLKNAVRSLADASNRDALTNIYNRRFLEQNMSKEFARIKRYGGTLSFIIMDLDHFKKVNDTYGHLAGDEILKITATKIRDQLRESDLLARYGGEEFAIMLPETSLSGAKILADRLCDKLATESIAFNDIELNISASMGVAEFQPCLDNHEQLISRADAALYSAKENGRNLVTLYDHDNPDAFSNFCNSSQLEQCSTSNTTANSEQEKLQSFIDSENEQSADEAYTDTKNLENTLAITETFAADKQEEAAPPNKILTDLSAEEKADLAMIETHGNNLQEVSEDIRQADDLEPMGIEPHKPENNTIRVKIGH